MIQHARADWRMAELSTGGSRCGERGWFACAWGPGTAGRQDNPCHHARYVPSAAAVHIQRQAIRQGGMPHLPAVLSRCAIMSNGIRDAISRSVLSRAHPDLTPSTMEPSLPFDRSGLLLVQPVFIRHGTQDARTRYGHHARVRLAEMHRGQPDMHIVQCHDEAADEPAVATRTSSGSTGPPIRRDSRRPDRSVMNFEQSPAMRDSGVPPYDGSNDSTVPRRKQRTHKALWVGGGRAPCPRLVLLRRRPPHHLLP
jgi:hypothetical protein